MKESNYSFWKPVEGQIMTRWVSDIDPKTPLPKYPRPQLKREEWLNLNGLWDYAICPKEISDVDNFEGKILVPYPIESALSGVRRKLNPNQKLWYHRKFTIPESWNKKKKLLHFGAVDWETTIWINKKLVGVHKGGYTPFYFEISDFLNNSKENEITLSVWDPTDKGHQEHGKQSLKPKVILYTAVSGIWQTVWLEPVSNTYIKSLKMVPNINKECLNLKVNVNDLKPNDITHIIIFEKNHQSIVDFETNENENVIKIHSPKLWSPDSPYLYKIIIEIKRNESIIDKVKSYFGMRKISFSKNKKGIKRIKLNGKPLFQYGTLDQGYWPDGLYTAPTDDALRYDIEITKELGFNMIRKHVKVEPVRWYYYCDKLGILVWQDMPNGGKLGLFQLLLNILRSKKRKRDWKRSETDKKQFYQEFEGIINNLYNHPSIITWVIFNENWGQFDTKRAVNFVRELDSSRLIDEASGWVDYNIGDIADCHKYVSPAMPKNVEDRVAVCGEFGGLGLEIKKHTWQKKIKFAYKKLEDSIDLFEFYAKLIDKLNLLKKKGLSGAVYTQITDVEGEINGLLTYDREVIKLNKKKLRELNLSLY
ncbi:MAG: glycoside hydrolase family 2 protein [Candidatus Hodarchaeota archaeon]